MKKTILFILFLLVVGLQTAWAQKVILKLAGSEPVKYDVSQVEYIAFEEDEPVIDGHEWVDLGLPSGTLWATCNVGASSPEEYGDFFAWGETQPKDMYKWSTYKYCNGSDNTMTKYCNNSSFGYNGFTDTLTELLPEDDAATANWGTGWQMPTIEQMKELYNNCSHQWTTQNSVNGVLVTGPNGNTIFLPAAGDRFYGDHYSVGNDGEYWSRSLSPSGDYSAFLLHFSSRYWFLDSNYRYVGESVRPVRVQN